MTQHMLCYRSKPGQQIITVWKITDKSSKAQYSIISQFDKMIAVGLASHNIVYLEFSRGCLDFEQNTENTVEWTGDSRK